MGWEVQGWVDYLSDPVVIIVMVLLRQYEFILRPIILIWLC